MADNVQTVRGGQRDRCRARVYDSWGGVAAGARMGPIPTGYRTRQKAGLSSCIRPIPRIYAEWRADRAIAARYWRGESPDCLVKTVEK